MNQDIPLFLLIGKTSYEFLREEPYLDQRPVAVLRSKGFRGALISVAVLRELLETGAVTELTEGEYHGYVPHKGVTQQQARTVTLPPYIPLEDRFPNWLSASAVFEAFPVTPLKFLVAGDKLVPDTRWSASLMASCPPEDRPAMETLLNDLKPFLEAAMQRAHPEDFLGQLGQLGTPAMLARLNQVALQVEQRRELLGEPTWIETANHLLGVKPHRLSVRISTHLTGDF